jgi:hypothetical protein
MSDSVPARPLAVLALSAGPREGEALPLPTPVVTVGRASSCEVVVDDDSVSDRHARLAYEGGAWSVTDLGSTNGTAVEGKRVEPNVAVPLPYGAALRLGGVQLRFTAVEEADLEGARAGYVPPAEAKTLREERSGARFPVWLLFVLAVLAMVIAIIVYTLVAPPPPIPAEAGVMDAPRLLALLAGVP